MQVKALKVFCDIVRHRSFSRAADENGISQSGASQTLLHLEDELGVRLIDRSKRPFLLTAAGKLYYQGCRKILERYLALEEEIRGLSHEVAGRVSVASIYSVGFSHMQEVVQAFLRRFPQANVQLHYEQPDRVYELIRTDRADLGLVSYPRDSRLVQVLPWRSEPMVLVCAPGHALAQFDRVSVRQLAEQPFIAFDADLRIRQETDKMLGRHDVAVQVAMEFDNIETMKRAVEIGTAVALLPLPTVARELSDKTLVARELSDVSFCRPLGIVIRRNVELGVTARRFIHLLRGELDLLDDPAARSDDPVAEPGGGRGAASPAAARATGDRSLPEIRVPTAGSPEASVLDTCRAAGD